MGKLVEVPMSREGDVGRALEKFSAGKAAMQIHASESVMKAAERARDPEKFEEAVRANLEAKRDFALAYQVAYPAIHAGPGRGKTDASTGAGFSPAEFCRNYGFALRSVQRWCERLLDQDKFDLELEVGLAKVTSLFLDIAKGDTTASKWTGDAESYTPAVYIESARIILGHHNKQRGPSDTRYEEEKAADDLSESWGLCALLFNKAIGSIEAI